MKHFYFLLTLLLGCLLQLSSTLPLAAQCSFTVNINPTGPINLPASGSQQLTAQAVTQAYNASGSGFNGVVYDTALQPDGKLLVGGSFNRYNGQLCSVNLVRLNSNGTLDNTFNTQALATGTGRGFSYSGSAGSILALALQPNGGIIAVGQFDSYNGYTGRDMTRHLIRLSADGAYSPAFNPSSSTTSLRGFNGASISDVVPQPDGKILVVGGFSQYNGVDCPDGLVRVNSDGTLDASFNPGGASLNNGFSAERIAVQANGQLLVGNGNVSGVGSFYNGQAVSRSLFRLNPNGSVDATFNTSPLGGPIRGFSSSANAFLPLPSGKVLVGGAFGSYNNIDCPNGLVRLNADGSLDTTFNPGGIGLIAGGSIQDLALQSDGKLLAGGVFSAYNGMDCPDQLMRLTVDGALDTSFNPSGAGFNLGTVRALAVQPDNQIIVGGNQWTTYNNVSITPTLMRVGSDGTLNSAIANATFSWNTGATTPSINVTQAGSYSVVATVGGCTAQSNVVLVTTVPILPVISSFTPTYAKSGQPVTVTGQNLSGATKLTFSGVAQPVFTVNAAGTQLTTTVPYANQTSSPDLPSGLVQVTTSAGTATSVMPLRLLAVTSAGILGYPGGLAGDNVGITGSGFTGATVAYMLNAVAYPVTYTVVSETQLTAVVPDVSGTTALSGSGGFVVTTTAGQSGANFEVLSPVIATLSPVSGPAGTVVTVTGFNFERIDPRSGASVPTSISGLTFNGVAGTGFQLLSSTQAQVTVPPGAATGYVRASGGTLHEGASRGVNFTVTSAAPDLVINGGTLANPTSVPAGTYNSIPSWMVALCSSLAPWLSTRVLPCKAGGRCLPTARR